MATVVAGFLAIAGLFGLGVLYGQPKVAVIAVGLAGAVYFIYATADVFAQYVLMMMNLCVGAIWVTGFIYVAYAIS